MFFVAALATTSCGSDDDGGGDGIDCTTIKFSTDIAPIVAASCATTGCHDAGSVVGDYTSYAGLEDRAKNGIMKQEVVVDKTMPKSGSLTQDEIDKFECWLDAGAPDN